ncbi:MAG: hypothetical protein V8Q85_06085 [Christensenellales bacterium]
MIHGTSILELDAWNAAFEQTEVHPDAYAHRRREKDEGAAVEPYRFGCDEGIPCARKRTGIPRGGN